MQVTAGLAVSIRSRARTIGIGRGTCDHAAELGFQRASFRIVWWCQSASAGTETEQAGMRLQAVDVACWLTTGVGGSIVRAWLIIVLRSIST